MPDTDTVIVLLSAFFAAAAIIIQAIDWMRSHLKDHIEDLEEHITELDAISEKYPGPNPEEIAVAFRPIPANQLEAIQKQAALREIIEAEMIMKDGTQDAQRENRRILRETAKAMREAERRRRPWVFASWVLFLIAACLPAFAPYLKKYSANSESSKPPPVSGQTTPSFLDAHVVFDVPPNERRPSVSRRSDLGLHGKVLYQTAPKSSCLMIFCSRGVVSGEVSAPRCIRRRSPGETGP